MSMATELIDRLPEYERDVILATLIEAEREEVNAKTPGREDAKETDSFDV